MVTGTKFRDDRSRGLLYLRARKFEPVTTFADPTISATGCQKALRRFLMHTAVMGYTRPCFWGASHPPERAAGKGI